MQQAAPADAIRARWRRSAPRRCEIDCWPRWYILKAPVAFRAQIGIADACERLGSRLALRAVPVFAQRVAVVRRGALRGSARSERAMPAQNCHALARTCSSFVQFLLHLRQLQERAGQLLLVVVLTPSRPSDTSACRFSARVLPSWRAARAWPDRSRPFARRRGEQREIGEQRPSPVSR